MRHQYLQYDILGDYYIQSADILVETALHNRSILDVHVYAICFLYRHGLELIMKDILWKSTYAISGTKEFPPMDHRLDVIWANVQQKIATFLHDSGQPLSEELSSVTRIIKMIMEHDPKSDSFRYPYDNQKRKSHPSLTHVNVHTLYLHIHEADVVLSHIREIVAYYYEQRDEL